MSSRIICLAILVNAMALLFACTQSKDTAAAPTVAPANWPAAPGVISVIGTAGGSNVFTFEKWRFTKAEMPDGKVENLDLAIEISTASLTTDWKDLEKGVKSKKDYFYVSKFPIARVAIQGAQPKGDGTYTCDALLTLKGVSKTVPLTFEISDSKPYQVKGDGMIFRSKFKFTGNGPEEEVPLNFDLTLPI
ncbi:MAG: YceI family protein [Bacteroidota bacterium]